VQIFYHGLNEQLRNYVDAACGGNFLNKDEDSAYDLFESMSENSLNQASMNTFGRINQPRGMYELQTNPNKIDLKNLC
jgi:hypothetical protein